MGQWNSFSAFSKVKLEIVTLVDEVSLAIEVMLEPAYNHTALDNDHGRYSNSKLKQVGDVLRVMKHFELALLVDEMQCLLSDVEKLEDTNNDKRIKSLQVLFLTINDFPAILEVILAGNDYNFDNYLPLINRIRELRGISQIFSPQVLLKDKSADYRKAVVSKSKKSRDQFSHELSEYKKAVELIVSGGSQKQGIKQLYSVFSTLEVLCRDFKIGTLWGVCVGLLESMPQLPNSDKSAILKKLCSFGKILEKLLDETESTLSKSLPKEVLNQLLGFISQTKVNSERLSAIKRHYNLDSGLVESAQLDYRQLLIQYFKRETSVRAIKFVLEDVSILSDSINIEASDQNKTKEEYELFEIEILRIKNTLQALGFASLSEAFDSYIDTFHHQVENFNELSSQDKEATLFKLAQLLYKLEVTLDTMVDDIDRGVLIHASKGMKLELSGGAKNNLLQEAIKNIELISTAIDLYVENECDICELANVGGWLAEIGAAVAAVPLPNAVRYISGARHYIENLLKCNKKLYIEKSFHNFVSLLINTKFYLERMIALPDDEIISKVSAMNSILTDLENFSFDFFEENIDLISSNDSIQSVIKVVDENLVEDDIKKVFIEEAEDIIPQIDKHLSIVSQGSNARDSISELRRCFHTLKGSGRLVGAICLGETSWQVESLLNKVISGSVNVDGKLLVIIEEVRASLPALIDGFSRSDKSAFSIEGAAQLSLKIESLLGKEIGLQKEEFQQELVNTDNNADVEDFKQPSLSKVLYKFDSENDSESESVEDDLSEVFIIETERQISKILNYLTNPQALDEDARKITTSSFIFPVHTLYGNSKAVYYSDFSNIIGPLESFLHEHPHQQMNEIFRQLIRSFCDLTKDVILEVKSAGRIPGQGHVIKNADDFISQLSFVDSEFSQNNSKQSIFSRTLQTVKNKFSQPSVLQEDELDSTISGFLQKPDINEEFHVQKGFLIEANATNCLILTILQAFKNDRKEVSHLINMQEQLNLLKGAAQVAEKAEVGEVCEELSSIYHNYLNRKFDFNDNIFIELESCHQYISYALDSIEKNLVISESAICLEPLKNSIAKQVEDQQQSIESEDDEPVEEILLATFLEEAEELLQELEITVAGWQKSPSKTSVTDDLLRSLHTLKGSAALVGENEISNLSHNFESFIIDSKNNSESMDSAFFIQVDAQLHALQNLYGLYRKDESGHIVKDKLDDDELGYLSRVSKNNQTTKKTVNEKVVVQPAEIVVPIATKNVKTIGKPESSTVNPISKPSEKVSSTPKGKRTKKNAAVDEQVRVSNKLLKSLLHEADENSIIRSRIEQNMTDFHDLLSDMDDTLGRLQNYIRQFDEHSKFNHDSDNESEAGMSSSDHEFDALEMDRYSQSQQLSSALLEDYNDLHDLKENFIRKVKATDGLLQQQQRSNNILQEGLISSQMVPFSGIVPRLKRLTRQVSADLNKKVEIIFSNPEGKIDRSILQAMIVPVEHMIRNAIDHGLEIPSDRIKKSKNEVGKILVKLYRIGPNIILDITDDGAGIDVAAIKRQAISKGLLSADVDISDQQAFQFLFHAGFSTTKKVSKISGRGVGMDVVYSEVKQIGGEIEVSSQQGEGTTFTVRLPFTSSLNRALLFNLNGDSFAMLLNTIDGIILESTDKLESYYAQTEIPLVEYSDKSYELKYMGKLLDEDAEPRLNTTEATAPILLISGKDQQMALQVDSVVGSRDFVIKSLGPQFSSIAGLSGAVILGDGNVVMVLDPKAMVDSAATSTGAVLSLKSTTRLGGDSIGALLTNGKDSKGSKTVLVVDDSITVRKVTSSILERNGMNVLVAKNGFDAIEILQHTVPDVMLLDIEMPKMDGFEVASFIRRQETSVKDMPIIMITSRIGEKHRTRAQEIGVNQYMCKPFQEQNLLEAIAEYN